MNEHEINQALQSELERRNYTVAVQAEGRVFVVQTAGVMSLLKAKARALELNSATQHLNPRPVYYVVKISHEVVL